MGQIFVENIKKYFGERAVLDGVSFVLGKLDKLSLVGANGTGKTTLIKIIVGQMEPDAGKVTFEGGSTIGYFAQDRAIDASDESLFSFIRKGFESVTETADRLEQITQQVMASPGDERLLGKLARLQSEYEARGGYELDLRIERILSGLGFSKEHWQRPLSSLSGGERARLQLACVLASNPNTLILDEPTNHLDLDATIWLEDFLKDFPGSVLIVSHDRYLLDKVCTHTVMLNDGKSWNTQGNYTVSRQKLDLERRQTLEKLQEQKQFVEKATKFIKRFKGYGTEIATKRAKNMERRLERELEKNVIEVPPQERQIKLNIESTGRAGEIVFKTKGLSKSFGEKRLFENAELEEKRGQKVALLGPNGCGKTTFLKIILGQEEPDAGSVWIGYNVEPVYLEQELGSFDPEATVMEEILHNSDLLPQEVRDHLATFLFFGEEVFKASKALSGGEISRLILAKLALIDANFLIFDEPTNHLDINARAALEDTIKNYKGTVFIVSHDRYFIKNIGATIWSFDDGVITDTRLILEEYLEKRSSATPKLDKKQPESPAQKKQQTGPSKNQVRAMQEDLVKMEQDIAKLELEKTELEKMMAEGYFYHLGDQTKTKLARYEEVKTQIDFLLHQWSELSVKLSVIVQN